MEELDAQSTSDTEYHKSAKRRRLSSDKGRQQFVGGSTKHTTSSNDISMGSQGTHLASEFDNSETTSHSDVKRPHTSESFDIPCKFSGKRINDLYIVEICAGSAKLSKASLDHGFMALAIDHKTTRSCGVAIQVWDLEDPHQLQLLLDFLNAEHDRIAMAWMAPACGTASRARERRLPNLEAQGVRVPGPLRSDRKSVV